MVNDKDDSEEKETATSEISVASIGSNEESVVEEVNPQQEDNEEEEEEEEQEDDDNDKDEDSDEESTVSAKKKTGGRKVTKSKSTKSSSSKKLSERSIDRSVTGQDAVRTTGRCSNCGNLLVQSKKLHYQEVKGLKADTRNKISVALCDDCQERAETGKSVELRTGMVKQPDGTIQNVSIVDLMEK